MFDHLFNSHKGEECVVMGNGPSLQDVPDSFFDDYPTFGSNRVYLRRIPDYFVCVNQLVLDQFHEEIQQTPTTRFVRERSGFTNSHELHLVTTEMFSFSPSRWVYDGHNVTFVALQLAFFMGFTKVYLVGVDHHYKFVGEPNQVLEMETDDPNHFTPGYFKGYKWQAPDLEVSEKAYKMAQEAYELNNRKIINLNPYSKLRVFEKQEPPWAQ